MKKNGFLFLILFFFTGIAGVGWGEGKRDSARRTSNKNRKGPTVLMSNTHARQRVTYVQMKVWLSITVQKQRRRTWRGVGDREARNCSDCLEQETSVVGVLVLMDWILKFLAMSSLEPSPEALEKNPLRRRRAVRLWTESSLGCTNKYRALLVDGCKV